MDKVKQFLEVARKHHFWILCGVVALVGLIVMVMATGKLSAQFKTWEGEIKGKLSSVQGITSPHPNQDWNDGMAKNTAAARESVRVSWTTLYQHEVDNIFKWPDALGKDFLSDIAKVEEGKKADLDRNLREHYQSFVEKYVKMLPKIVDAAVAETNSSGSPQRQPEPMIDPRTGQQIFHDYKVEWDQASQQLIFDTFTWYERPSTAMVRQAQEELWVYEALCRVIERVNRDAKGSHDAPIRAIQEMAIAYLAQNTGGTGMMSNAGSVHRVQRVKAQSTGGMGDMGGPGAAGVGGEPGAPAGTPPDPKTRGKPDAGGMRGGGLGAAGPMDPSAAVPGGNPDDIWKGFRYVNEEGKPLATAADVDASPLEYNLMPFRMKLSINPKEIDSLLIELRNSTLPLEVKEIHVFGGSTTPTSTGGGIGGGFGGRGFSGRGGMDDGEGFGGGRPSMPSPGASAAGVGPQQKLVLVEVSGVAYLMKKPDPAKLGIVPAEGGAPADAAADPATQPNPTPPQAMNLFDRDPIAKDWAENHAIRFRRSSLLVKFV